MNHKLNLTVVEGIYAVAKLSPTETVPSWAQQGNIHSATATSDELSIVCDESSVPADTTAERGWRCLQVIGQLDFGLTGILAAIAVPLAEARISIFALSTFNTDYILVKQSHLQEALAVLRLAGHNIQEQ